MTKSVTCLFLGSGASYALAGIPPQSEFLCSVLNNVKARWIDNCGVDRKIKIGNRRLSSWMLDVGDVELCMSYLHNRADYAMPEERLLICVWPLQIISGVPDQSAIFE
jgi:hypothetical protein